MVFFPLENLKSDIIGIYVEKNQYFVYEIFPRDTLRAVLEINVKKILEI